jgi:hypothetical protein
MSGGAEGEVAAAVHGAAARVLVAAATVLHGGLPKPCGAARMHGCSHFFVDERDAAGRAVVRLLMGGLLTAPPETEVKRASGRVGGRASRHRCGWIPLSRPPSPVLRLDHTHSVDANACHQRVPPESCTVR